MTFLTFLIIIDDKMTPASTDLTRELFSARTKSIFGAYHFERAHQNNKKDTIGPKCHRCNARPACAFLQRYFADRETLSRVLQSAHVAGQGMHTTQEALHGHFSCARSEDPVWTWSRWTGLARASERKRAGGEGGRFFPSEGDAFSALMIKFRIFVATTSSPGAPQLWISRAWGADPGWSKCAPQSFRSGG